MSFKSQGDLMLCLEGAGMTDEACLHHHLGHPPNAEHHPTHVTVEVDYTTCLACSAEPHEPAK
jgi:hypothetical protein